MYPIADRYTRENKVVFISLDLETGGEHCGVVQISAKVFWVVVGTNEVSRQASYFNEYVEPPHGAMLSQHITEVYGLHA